MPGVGGEKVNQSKKMHIVKLNGIINLCKPGTVFSIPKNI